MEFLHLADANKHLIYAIDQDLTDDLLFSSIMLPLHTTISYAYKKKEFLHDKLILYKSL